MVETADDLRRKIATYRRMLAEGMPAETAQLLLEQITELHAALAVIEAHNKDERSRKPSRS